MSNAFSIINNPLEQFQIVPIIPIKSGAVDISFTNSALMMTLATGFFVALSRAILVDGNGNLVPNRWQSLIESIYAFIQDMVFSNVGERGQGFFPMLFVLFVFLLVCNLIGMVPYSFTVTSHLIVTLALSLTVYIGVTWILFREHGFHALSLFLPAGAPFALYFLLIGIELISNVIRVVSLSVRLFANMMSGHILLKVLLGTNRYALWYDAIYLFRSNVLLRIFLGILPFKLKPNPRNWRSLAAKRYRGIKCLGSSTT